MTAGSLPVQVLIVDDEPAIPLFLRTSLHAQNYQTIEAETGAEALNMFAQPRRCCGPRSGIAGF